MRIASYLRLGLSSRLLELSSLALNSLSAIVRLRILAVGLLLLLGQVLILERCCIALAWCALERSHSAIGVVGVVLGILGAFHDGSFDFA